MDLLRHVASRMTNDQKKHSYLLKYIVKLYIYYYYEYIFTSLQKGRFMK
jgi:hypothetical protein